MSNLIERLASMPPEKRFYSVQTLVAHLEEAGRFDEIHHLLALETDEQQNAWYQAKDAYHSNSVESYRADVTCALGTLEERFSLQSNRFDEGYFGLQCRYALIISSLNSLVQNIPPVLLHSLVKQGIWTLQRGMMHARQVLDRRQRVEAMIEVLPLIENKTEQKKWFQETLVDIRALEEEDDQVKMLLSLVDHYSDPKPEEVLRDVLYVLPGSAQTLPGALLEMAPYLSETLRREARHMTQSIGVYSC
jgi:hypothetical protein